MVRSLIRKGRNFGREINLIKTITEYTRFVGSQKQGFKVQKEIDLALESECQEMNSITREQQIPNLFYTKITSLSKETRNNCDSKGQKKGKREKENISNSKTKN